MVLVLVTCVVIGGTGAGAGGCCIGRGVFFFDSGCTDDAGASTFTVAFSSSCSSSKGNESMGNVLRAKKNGAPGPLGEICFSFTSLSSFLLLLGEELWYSHVVVCDGSTMVDLGVPLWNELTKAEIP